LMEQSFQCVSQYPKLIPQLLGCLEFGKDQVVLCQVSPAGLRFIVDDSKAMQASTEIPRECFQDYIFNSEEEPKIEFRVQLQMLCDCLKLFGELSGKLSLEYTTVDKQLCIMMEDTSNSSLVVDTKFQLQTMDSHFSALDFKFQDYPCDHYAILKAEDLKDALQELEWLGGSALELIMSDKDPFFALTCHGDCGQAQVEFPSESEVFFRFECGSEQTASYSMSMAQKMKAALSLSDQVQVRMNEQGLLSLQCSTKSYDGHSAFVDFLINPTFIEE